MQRSAALIGKIISACTLLVLVSAFAYGQVAAIASTPDTTTPHFSTQTIPPAYRGAVAGWAAKLGPYYRNLRRDKAHYLRFIRGLLSSAGLPEELALIAVVESGFSAEATSVDGAAGVWQLMPAVAIESALSLAPVDGRRDVYKSSHVALKIIRDLSRRFAGDTLMVVAAYNCGPGRAESAGATTTSDYWAVHPALPPETQAHVLKYLAAVSVFHDQPLPAPPVQRARRDSNGLRNVLPTTALSASYREAAILQVLKMDTTTFRTLNPALDATLNAEGAYDMQLPEREMLQFLHHKRAILSRSMAAPKPTAIEP